MRMIEGLKSAKELEQELANLDIQQTVLEQVRTFCGHIITPEAFRSSPIRRIPDDILGAIFVAAKAGEPDRVGTGVSAVVTQVCARWRNVACAHPRFWSAFAFPLFGKEGTVDLLRMTFERCKAAHLTVIVDASKPKHMGSSEQQKIALLTRHAENIVSLRFCGQEHFFSPFFQAFAAFHDRLPRLELLGFSHWWRVGKVLERAPRLSTLELGRSADLLELKSLLPIEQISTIRFSVSTSGYHLGSFPNHTSMVSIQTEPSLPVNVNVVQNPPPLRALTTWRVEFSKPPEVKAHPMNVVVTPPISTTNFFARFRTPALRTLHICRLTSVDGVVQLFQDSECELTTLVLEEPLIAANDLFRFLACTPALQSLEILSGQATVLSNGFFSALTFRHGPFNDRLPRLTHFRVAVRSYHTVTDITA
ncbi:hypothetical protein B0H19DRAFT_234252 [Mycena capillaripes]|nr:hypothetical protein B0H19DRAFT_234252 [Mycena capillaripes]